jgi:polysaccharide biosynthesis protein PslG
MLVACGLVVAAGVIWAVVSQSGAMTSKSNTSRRASAFGATTGGTRRFGMNGPQVWMPTMTRRRELDGMKALGVELVRMDVPWADVERTNDSWTYKKIDNEVNEILVRGMTPLLVPTYCTPRWANSHRGCYAPPTDASEYGEFVGHLVSHYAPRGIHFYEIWNEPNNGAFFAPAPDPSKYTQMLKSAYTNAHAEDASALVICCALALGAGDPVGFMRGIYSSGGHGYFDAVSLHPYTFAARPSQLPNTAWPGSTDDLHELMASHGDGGLKIWATEFGTPSAPSTGCSDGCSELNQREALIEAFDRWGGRHSFATYLGPLFIYHYRDECSDTTSAECFFGIVDHDWVPKPAYTAVEGVLAEGR